MSQIGLVTAKRLVALASRSSGEDGTRPAAQLSPTQSTIAELARALGRQAAREAFANANQASPAAAEAAA